MEAKPLRVFRLGSKRVIVCQLAGNNPMCFLDHDFGFYVQGELAGKIRIEGVSTVGDVANGICDFSYSGDEILPEQIGETSIISDRPIRKTEEESALA